MELVSPSHGVGRGEEDTHIFCEIHSLLFVYTSVLTSSSMISPQVKPQHSRAGELSKEESEIIKEGVHEVELIL